METKLYVKLIAHTTTPEKVIASSGKLCYSSVGVDAINGKMNEEEITRFVSMLLKLGHESPLEHCTFTFAIEGVSRSLTHQLVRHRIASYSQQSQRYVKEKQFEYVVPKAIKRNLSLCENYEEYMRETQNLYDFITDNLIFDFLTLKEEDRGLRILCKKNKVDYDELFDFILQERRNYDLYWMANKRTILFKVQEKYPKIFNALTKRAIENARYILPNATETKIITTMNLRSLINFCKHRMCNRAQEEIQELAIEMAKEVRKISPILAQMLGASCQLGKGCPEGVMTCGTPLGKLNV